MSATAPGATHSGRRLFISYARADSDAVQLLVKLLRAMRHDPWFDNELESEGGKEWWDRILSEIRNCDAVVVAVSPALTKSVPARLERQYARDLGKPVVAVMVETILHTLLPRELAILQIVDLTEAGPMTGINLANTLAGLGPAPPLPDPMPALPDVPLSYLGDLADRVRAETMTQDEQLHLITKLRLELKDRRGRKAAIALLHELSERRDLYADAWQELDSVLRVAREEKSEPRATPTPADPTPASAPSGPAPPAGWYRDPSGRHELRWFSTDWTDYAADHGEVVEDPDF
ncbi:TIR domain-containing protein [Kitasatospora sp. NPDC047058]|uniref:toll/interleukin-1 receptor domain-containing protein n=1 Tax=Kitasatospora sp. NPDC047058 TaxID=3155620 RepID=UPI0033CB41C4